MAKQHAPPFVWFFVYLSVLLSARVGQAATVEVDYAQSERFFRLLNHLKSAETGSGQLTQISEAIGGFYGRSEVDALGIHLNFALQNFYFESVVGGFGRGQAANPIFPQLEIYAFVGLHQTFGWRRDLGHAFALDVLPRGQIGQEYLASQRGTDLIDQIQLRRGWQSALEPELGMKKRWADYQMVGALSWLYSDHASRRAFGHQTFYTLQVGRTFRLGPTETTVCGFYSNDGSGCEVPTASIFERAYLATFWAKPAGFDRLGITIGVKRTAGRFKPYGLGGMYARSGVARLGFWLEPVDFGIETHVVSASRDYRNMRGREFRARVAVQF